VLVAQFRRFWLALVVLVSVPMAAVGALATLWLTSVPLNASSLMGCVLLVGLVVKNGILLLEQFERSFEESHDVEHALIEAGGNSRAAYSHDHAGNDCRLWRRWLSESARARRSNGPSRWR